MALKRRIVAELEARRGEAVSGQWLAGQLGVSRSAVWKAIRALQAEGYAVEAVTNRGYRLLPGTDVLSAEGVALHLCPAHRPLLAALKTTDSTNAEAKRRIIAGGAQEMLVFADTQTAGRGRRGNSFFSPSGRGIYMSAVLCPNRRLADTLRITAAAAVSVCEAVEAICGRAPQIKWVNDLFLDGKKLCGILCEGVSDLETGMAEAIIVGIGINFRTGSFPDELERVATALDPPASLTRNELIAAVANRLYGWAERLDDPALMAAYRARSMILGKTIRFRRGSEAFEGVAQAINEDGNLVVRLAGGRLETLSAGEISIGSGSLAQ